MSDERREEIREGWLRHLDAIPEADSDAARYESREFVRLLDGLLDPEDLVVAEDETEAEP